MPEVFSLQIEIGDAVHVLRVMEAAAENADELMRDVLLVMIRSTQQTFELEGRPRWNDLAESTERRRFQRAARGRGNLARSGSLGLLGAINILRDTGMLYMSVGGGAGGAFEAGEGFGESDEFSAIIGTSQPGWQNQFPDSRGWRDARVFLEFQEQDIEDIADMNRDWMMRVGPYAA